MLASTKTLTITAILAVLSISVLSLTLDSENADGTEIIASGGASNGTSADYTWTLDSDSVMTITGFNRTIITPESLAPFAPFDWFWQGDAHAQNDFVHLSMDTAPYIYFLDCVESTSGTYTWQITTPGTHMIYQPTICRYQSTEQTDKTLPTTLISTDNSGPDFVGTWESSRILSTGQLTGTMWISPEELSIKEVVIDSTTADIIYLPPWVEGKILTISENTKNLSNSLLDTVYATDGTTELTTADMPGRSFLATTDNNKSIWLEIDRTAPTEPEEPTAPSDTTDNSATQIIIFQKVVSKIALAVISVILTVLSHLGLR